MAVRYAALSACRKVRMSSARAEKYMCVIVILTLGNGNGTDGQTDRQTVRRNMRPPPREEGRIIK